MPVLLRIPGDARKAGDRPMGVPDVEKKLGRFGVEGNGVDKTVAFFAGRFRGDSMLPVALGGSFLLAWNLIS